MDALAGRGNTVFISGEAGIGKTRLLEEIRSLAKSKGFRVLWGNSLYESLTPYMPFMEALRSGGLESLFVEESPNVEAVYLVTDTGLLIKDVVRKESRLDSHIFASMLTAVGEFVKDSLAIMRGEEKGFSLSRLDYGDCSILIEKGKNTNLAVILTGRENEFLINDMREILVNVDKGFGGVLEKWDGKDSGVQGIENVLQPLITSGKYDGIYYGLEDPKARRNLLFENVSLGLVRQAESNPTLLCIEDLHWADPSSLALMHYVARNTRECSLLILGTYRPEDVAAREGRAHPLVETMQLMDREDLCKKMELRRLPKEMMSDFLNALLGEVDFEDKFMDRMYKETEGNPLFVIELAKLLVEEGIVRMDDGPWKLSKDVEDVDIPSKIHDVIVRRLDRLEEEEREILDYAAVIGEEFTSNVLESAKKISKIELLKHLRKLEQRHKLIHTFDGEYRFDHAKIKEVIYNEIPRELRMEYHSVIANSIERINKDNIKEVIEDLAFHYYHCRNKEKALHYLMRAAERAKKEFSNDEIIRYYSEAMEFEEDRQQRFKMLKALGDANRYIGDYEKSIEFYNNAHNLAEGRAERCDAKVSIGTVHMNRGEFKEAIRIGIEALELIGGEECKEKTTALRVIGLAYMRIGKQDEALRYTKDSLEVSQRIGNQRGVAGALNNIGMIWNIRGELDKAMRYYEKALETSEKTDHHDFIYKHLGNIGNIYIAMGEPDKALSYIEKALKVANMIGDQMGLMLNLENMGAAHSKKGDYDKALELSEKSLAISKKLNDLGTQCMILCNIAEFLFLKKNIEKSLDFCNQSYNLSKRIGLKLEAGISSRVFGMIYCGQKKWEQSIESFGESVRILKEVGAQNESAETRFEFGLMWKAKGDLDKAREQLSYAKEIFTKMNLKTKLEKVDEVLSDLEKLKE